MLYSYSILYYSFLTFITKYNYKQFVRRISFPRLQEQITWGLKFILLNSGVHKIETCVCWGHSLSGVFVEDLFFTLFGF